MYHSCRKTHMIPCVWIWKISFDRLMVGRSPAFAASQILSARGLPTTLDSPQPPLQVGRGTPDMTMKWAAMSLHVGTPVAAEQGGRRERGRARGGEKESPWRVRRYRNKQRRRGWSRTKQQAGRGRSRRYLEMPIPENRKRTAGKRPRDETKPFNASCRCDVWTRTSE